MRSTRPRCLSDRVAVMSARPGRLIDVIHHRLAARARFRPGGRPRIRRLHRAAVGAAARGIAQGDGHDMSRVASVADRADREARCSRWKSSAALGIINRLTMIPPSQMVVALGEIAVEQVLVLAGRQLHADQHRLGGGDLGRRRLPHRPPRPRAAALAPRARSDLHLLLLGADLHPLSPADRVLRHRPVVADRHGRPVRHRRHDRRHRSSPSTASPACC